MRSVMRYAHLCNGRRCLFFEGQTSRKPHQKNVLSHSLFPLWETTSLHQKDQREQGIGRERERERMAVEQVWRSFIIEKERKRKEKKRKEKRKKEKKKKRKKKKEKEKKRKENMFSFSESEYRGRGGYLKWVS